MSDLRIFPLFMVHWFSSYRRKIYSAPINVIEHRCITESLTSSTDIKRRTENRVWHSMCLECYVYVSWFYMHWHVTDPNVMSCGIIIVTRKPQQIECPLVLSASDYNPLQKTPNLLSFTACSVFPSYRIQLLDRTFNTCISCHIVCQRNTAIIAYTHILCSR